MHAMQAGSPLSIALVALSVRGAMGEYVEQLAAALQKSCRLHLFVPQHYSFAAGGEGMQVHRFVTGSTRLRAGLSLINLLGARKLFREIRDAKPDVVHLLNGEGYPWSPLLARWCKRASLPLVVTVHDPEPHQNTLSERVQMFLRRSVLKNATRVHIHSARFAETLVKQGVEIERQSVVPHGSFAPRYVQYRQDEIERERMALFFGRLEHYKGLDVLVQAGLLLKGQLRILIAGPGSLPPSLLKTIAERPEIFELRQGFIQDAEVTLLFQRAAVCVLPYRQCTQSAVPLIAAALGTPVVASALGGFLDDVPQVNGILVPSENPAALSDGILAALGRPVNYPLDREFSHLAIRFLQLYANSLTAKRSG